MNQQIQEQLDGLETKIQSLGFLEEAKETRHWEGADVGISDRLDRNLKRWLGDQPLVIGLQDSQPRKRAVITKHAKELSWLFTQLGSIFSARIDYVSKYDFYGILAQAALNHLESESEHEDCRPLLIAVMSQARDIEFSR